MNTYAYAYYEYLLITFFERNLGSCDHSVFFFFRCMECRLMWGGGVIYSNLT